MIINRLYIKYFILLFIVAGITACARISSPGGGPKDEDPPQLLISYPPTGQTEFDGQVIILEFDELVTTNQIESNLIITPKPEGSFRTRVNRNKIQLEFSEPFQDSTTYTFSFASSIEDLTDGNTARDLNLSFSTGDYLDSLQVSGQIRNLYDQVPEEDILVSLYSSQDTLNILNGSASYYTKTDSAGNYLFQNLPPDKYRVYAVQDKNNNNKADSDGELYGFYTDTLNLIDNINSIDFTIQSLSTKDLRLISGRHFGRYYELSFNKSIIDFSIQDSTNYLYQQTKPDIVRFYRTNELFNDTTNLIFEARDSLGTVLIDTAKYYFIESEIAADPFNSNIAPKRSLFRPQEDLVLTFNKPANLINIDSVQVFVDSLNVYPIAREQIVSNANQTVFTLPIQITDYVNRPDQKAKIEFKPGTFISVDSDTNSYIQKSAQIAIEQETALISGSVNTSAPNVIVQLLNAQSLQVLEETNDKNFSFSYLNAGSYMIRAINDLNSNGQWDTGNIFKNEAPEPAAFYYDTEYNTQLIEVRKNWAREQINISLR